MVPHGDQGEEGQERHHPCHSCGIWRTSDHLLTSKRQEHEFINPKHEDNRVSHGRLCADCVHIFEIDEAPLGTIPRPIEAILEEITGNLKARTTNKVGI